MSAQPVGRFLTIREVLDLFLAMGCEIRTATLARVTASDTDEGRQTVRFLHCPETNGFYPIDDLEDDERLPPSEVETMELRLGLEIPKPK